MPPACGWPEPLPRREAPSRCGSGLYVRRRRPEGSHLPVAGGTARRRALSALTARAVRRGGDAGESSGACTVPEDLGTCPSSAVAGLFAFRLVDVREGEAEQLAHRELIGERWKVGGAH